MRRLASKSNGMVDEVLGIKRADGSLPDAVLRANLVASNAASISRRSGTASSLASSAR